MEWMRYNVEWKNQSIEYLEYCIIYIKLKSTKLSNIWFRDPYLDIVYMKGQGTLKHVIWDSSPPWQEDREKQV